MKKIYIYFHICTLGPFREVVREMMDMCVSTGLLDHITEIRYFVLGIRTEDVVRIMNEYPKTVLVAQNKNGKHLYERYTLHALKRDVMDASEPFYVLYLHSKGVSPKSQYNPCVGRWRQLMLYALAMYRELCWNLLDQGVDAVGIFYRNKPAHHFSGNFWWSSSSYLQTLDVPIGPTYLAPEMWIGTKWKRAVSLQQQHTGCLYRYVPGLLDFMSFCSIHYVVDDNNNNNNNNHPVETNIPWKKVKRLQMGIGNQWLECCGQKARLLSEPVTATKEMLFCEQHQQNITNPTQQPPPEIQQIFRVFFEDSNTPIMFFQNTLVIPGH